MEPPRTRLTTKTVSNNPAIGKMLLMKLILKYR
jgi:hypothetical protein